MTRLCSDEALLVPSGQNVATTRFRFVMVISMLRYLLLAAIVFSTVGSYSKDKSLERVQRPGPIHLDRDGRKWADKTLRKMSTEEKVGQLFMIWVKVQFLNEADPTWLELRDNVRKYHIGFARDDGAGGWAGAAEEPAL